MIAYGYRFIFITQHVLSLSILIDTPNRGFINILLIKILCSFIILILGRCAQAKMYNFPPTHKNSMLAKCRILVALRINDLF